MKTRHCGQNAPAGATFAQQADAMKTRPWNGEITARVIRDEGT
jgi:hypothetical protein